MRLFPVLAGVTLLLTGDVHYRCLPDGIRPS